ncbi:hypothetical protein KTN05_04395 [Paracoccus sp. Z118]|uniref:hypothetical protein n=1 Tax=Paracoccus sp. Z118 TaxID=2851017 RepID=UPI001C2CAD09|nr:hypothetical protein [Paracoccus sp. Z118]MBV0891089.1 hypothetical protein [Paracoccus sp. Z118]
MTKPARTARTRKADPPVHTAAEALAETARELAAEAAAEGNPIDLPGDLDEREEKAGTRCQGLGDAAGGGALMDRLTRASAHHCSGPRNPEWVICRPRHAPDPPPACPSDWLTACTRRNQFHVRQSPAMARLR